MVTLLDDFFERRRLVLYKSTYEDVHVRLGGLLTWLESTPQTKRVILDIEAAVDTKTILDRCDAGHPPIVSTPEEVAAVGILIMRQCALGAKLYDLASIMGISPPYTTTSLQSHADAALDRFVGPALDFIEARLGEVTPEALVDEQVADVFSESFKEKCPSTTEHLKRITEEFSKPEENGEWFNIGNSCREALKTFTAEIQKVSGEAKPEGAKAGDVRRILQQLFRQVIGKGRFQETLTNLMVAVWDHSQSITHRGSTSKEEARRLFIWTALAISQSFGVVQEAKSSKSQK